MSFELYVYTTPPASQVQMRLDNGIVVVGQGPLTANGRNDAHLLLVSAGTSGQGAVLEISSDGFAPFSNRGLFVPNDHGPSYFMLDDVRLVAADAAPIVEPPKPTYPTGAPQDIINAVYQQGDFDLNTKDGCGKFTEACCDALHASDQMWGHIGKNPGQNQYNQHAVDALMLLAGDGCGIWDIILDSESPNAQPSYSYKGEPVSELWHYPAGTYTGSYAARRRRTQAG